MMSGQVYEFGPFRYDAGQRLLFRQGEVLPLMPKALETLHVLLENRGRVVEKSELMRLVWPDTVVEEVGLARNISLLRKALGGDGEECAFIETIPKRGYRFVAEVSIPSPEGLAPTRRPASARRWMIAAAAFVAVLAFVYWQFYMPSRYLPGASASLAVIPFECLSPEPDCTAFSQAFGEVLVADLSKLQRVHVISPGTVGRYRRLNIPAAMMGRILGLEVVVEGTFQKVGDRLRMTARLVDVHSGKLIWADAADVAASDLDRGPVDAARNVAAQVGARLASSPSR